MTIGEWYHCYTRGVDKRTVFETRDDYERFMTHLYVANNTKNIRVSDLRSSSLHAVLADESLGSRDPLTELGAFCLMPTHAHFLLRETRDRGIATFMQRIFTGYTMYFNNNNDRTGSLFSGTYKSKHVDDDRYLKQVLPYILLNPAELFEPDWKNGIGDLAFLKTRLLEYPFSSLPSFFDKTRPESKLINSTLESYFDHLPSLEDMLRDAQEYYRATNPQV